MQISVVRPSELGRGEIAAWHSMQRKTGSLANPFLCPEFAIAVDTFRTDARVAVLTDGPETVGFFPFQKRWFGVGVPIGAGLSDCQALIHEPGVEWDARSLLRACNLSVWQFDHLVEDQHPFERYVAAVVPSPVIDVTDGFAVYYEKLRMKSPRFCQDLARRARKLEREVGELHFVMDSSDLTGLRALMSWKSDQYRRRGWFDRFDRPWIVDLIDYLFSTREDRFGGLLSLLYAGETPVAGHFGLRSNHILAHWFPAYDTGFSRQSPGLIQHLRMAEGSAALGVHLIDLGKGAERYKQTLKSHELYVAEGTVARGTPLANVHRVQSNAIDRARSRVKRHPRVLRAIDQLFRHFGRIS